MNRFRSAAAAAFVALAAFGVQATTLFDASLGTPPSAQGWSAFGTPGYAQSFVGGAYRLDTSSANAVMAGSGLSGVAGLDSAGAGFELDFGLRIVAESHARVDRAGFSVIFTGADPTHALELGFWSDRIFALTPAFLHGVEALLDTTSATGYALVVSGNRYSLRANGALLLTGSLVDYSAFGAPYNQPGFLFFGDDTSSAASVSDLGRVALIAAVPEPGTTALTAAGLAALVAWRRRRRTAPALRR